MSRMVHYLLAGALVVLLAACGSTEPPPGPKSNLQLLFTSDEHSHFFASSPEVDDYPYATTVGTGALRGGIARRATILKEQRALADSAGMATLTFSSGDSDFGALPSVTFTSGSIDLEEMHDLDYAVMTLGNHEFDFGPAALAEAISAAQQDGKLVPIVASNIHFSSTDPGDDTLAALFSEDASDDKPIHRYRVITTPNGIKVGVIGYVGVSASRDAPNKAPVTFSERGLPASDQADPEIVLPKLYADLQPVVDQVRSQADIVVALSHAGVGNLSDAQDSEDYRIAENVSGIDVILSGHAHQSDPKAIEVENKQTGKKVLLLNAGYYGYQLGRVELRVPTTGSGSITWNTKTQTLLPVDDTTLPDPDVVAATPGILTRIETAKAKDGNSYLGELLGRAGGLTQAQAVPGALYFEKLAHTSFDITNTHALLFLTADADLRAADTVEHTDIALQSAGQIFGVLEKGRTGNVSAADAFSVVPLGDSPVDQTRGYPLVRVYVSLFELRAIFEFASTLSPTDSNYDLGTAGVRVEYDCSRPPVTSISDMFYASKGRVVRIYLDTDHENGLEQFDHVIFDKLGKVSEDRLYSIVATSYIAQFAGELGIDLKDENGKSITIPDAILHRTDGSEVKELEAFFHYLHTGLAGEVPARYNPAAAGATKRFADFAPCGS